MSHVDEGRLHAFLDGELDDTEAVEVEEHLAVCSACEALLEEAARVHAVSAKLIAEAGLATGGPEWSELMARADGASSDARRTGEVPLPSAAWWRPRSYLVPGLAWAATLAMAFALGWQARQSGDLTGQRPESAMEPAPAPARSSAAAPELSSDSAPAQPEDEDGQLPAMEGVDMEIRLDALERDTLPAAANEAGERERSATRPQPPPAAPDPSAKRQASFRMLESRAEEAFADTAESRLAEFESIDPGAAAERLGGEPLRLPLTDIRSAAIGPPGAIEGGDPDLPVLRLVFDYSGGTQEITLMQQYVGGAAGVDLEGPVATQVGGADRRGQQMAQRRDAPEPANVAAALSADLETMLTDAVLTIEPSGLRRLSWRDGRGYLLVLVAELQEEELLRLAESLR